MPLERVVTIGVYGFDADRFFSALIEGAIDLFCDVRARRGVRGREYAFANANGLEARLAELQIRYAHYKALAPTQEIRRLQYAEDTATGVAKRERARLSPSFVAAYGALLATPDAVAAVEDIRRTATSPVLFCVERLPSACHRSLVAARVAAGRVPVENIVA